MKKIFLIGLGILVVSSLFLLPLQGKGAVPPCPDEDRYAVDGTLLNPDACNPRGAEKTGGFIPCGRESDDPNTPICECSRCQFCHIFVLINNIINFILTRLTPIIAGLMLVIGGFYFLIAGPSPEKVSQAKSIITAVVIGLVIIFVAWVILNTLLTYIEVAKWTGFFDKPATPEVEGWWLISCE